MQELIRVRLENEMDLILAHKRAMKLAELVGLSLPAQTTFATAVSEVARTTCENGRCGTLVLSVDNDERERYIVARLENEQYHERQREGLEFAKRLVSKYKLSLGGGGSKVDLFVGVAQNLRIDLQKLDEWRQLFRNEPPVSPYEELKRRNDQLRELAERVQKSELQYKTLTNSLPLVIFSLNAAGELVFANSWLETLTGESTTQINRSGWTGIVHPDDQERLRQLMDLDHLEGIAQLQVRLRRRQDGLWLWHQLMLIPLQGTQPDHPLRIGYIVDIHAQKIVEETLKNNEELIAVQAALQEKQAELEDTIVELNRSNQELQQFAYVASHDLQEPVRKVLYYSDYLIDQYASQVAGKGKEYLKNIQGSAHRMRALIHDVLALSQINRGTSEFVPVKLSEVMAAALQDLDIRLAETGGAVDVAPLPEIMGDAPLLRQLFSNLVGNSLKYARPGVPARVQVSAVRQGDEHVIAIADNGIGFDEKYLPRLFGIFQRMQHQKNLEGTGIGLAICKKIAEVHDGRIWAHSEEGSGTTFFVAFPVTA